MGKLALRTTEPLAFGKIEVEVKVEIEVFLLVRIRSGGWSKIPEL